MSGVSSETIWSVMTGLPVKDAGHPYDPDDFGRCYRLLQHFPAWRSRLGEVAAAYPNTPWVDYVEHWSEMEVLWEEESQRRDGMARKLYALMQKIRGVRA